MVVVHPSTDDATSRRRAKICSVHSHVNIQIIQYMARTKSINNAGAAAGIHASFMPSRHGAHGTGRAKKLFVRNEARIRGEARRDDTVRRRVVSRGGVRGKERAARARPGSRGVARPMGGARRRVARIRLALGASLVGTGLPRPGCEHTGR